MSQAGPSRRHHGGEEYEDGEVVDYPSSSSSRHELPSRPQRIRPVQGWNATSEPAKDWRNPFEKTPPSRSVSPEKPRHPLPPNPNDTRAQSSQDRVDTSLPPRPRSRERSRDREKPREREKHAPSGPRQEERHEPRRDSERGNFITIKGGAERRERYGDDRGDSYRGDWKRHGQRDEMYDEGRSRDTDRYDRYGPGGHDRSDRDYRNGNRYGGRDGRDGRDRRDDPRRRIDYGSDEDDRYGSRDRSYRDDRRDNDRRRDRYDEPNGHRREHERRYDDDKRSYREEGRRDPNQHSITYDDFSLPSQPSLAAAPTPPPPPDEEDGEVPETSRPNTPSVSPPKVSAYDAFEESAYQVGFPSVDPNENDQPSDQGTDSSTGFKPPKLTMKREYRPVVPLPPTDTPPAPPPPADTPPQPPETPPAGQASPNGEKQFERDVPPPAPNPNILHPSTRPPSPRSVRPEAPLVVSHLPGTYKRRSNGEENKALGRVFVGTSTLEGYDVGSKLGEGTFGIVTKGVQIATKRAVALKHLLMHNPRDGVSTTTIREIKILKCLNHPNVVPILDMIVNPKSKTDKSGRQDIFMVFPFMDHDLCGLLGNRDFKPAISVRKLIMKQMLEGLAYIHANDIVHRDIKTANILVDDHGQVMIADFGLARAWTPPKEAGLANGSANGSDPMPAHTMQEYTNMVVTRWYRAPELLLGDTHYGPAVDMWSMGCILGEMYFREPILAAKGHTDDGQLPLILEHCGPLNDDTFPGWQELPGYPEMQGHRWDQTPVGETIVEMAKRWGMGEQDGHLLKRMLTLDPRQRITADDALDHDWFWTNPMPAAVEKTHLGVESSHEMTMRQTQQPVAPAPAYRPQQFRPRPPRPQGIVRPGQFHAQHPQGHHPNGNANGFRPGYNARPPFNGPPNQFNNPQNQYNQYNGNGYPGQPGIPNRPYGGIPPKPMGTLSNAPSGPRSSAPPAPFLLAGSSNYSGPRGQRNHPPALGQGHGHGGTHALSTAPHAMGLKRAAPFGPSEGREKRPRAAPEPGEVTELPYD